MSAPAQADVAIFRWQHGELERLDFFDMTDVLIEVADSWLVTGGRVLALDLHRTRFFTSINRQGFELPDLAAFWDAALATIPIEGDWFPRVELQTRRGMPTLAFRLRPAPIRSRSVRLATYDGMDPRTNASIKGPDFDALLRIRTEAQLRGADEAVILTSTGAVVEGAYSALVWWRGDVLCAPAVELERVDSVTAKSLLTLAAVFDVDTYFDVVTPQQLQGLEVWALNALHGVRIATAWIDGPSLAELPGRLGLWRRRLEALRKPITLGDHASEHQH